MSDFANVHDAAKALLNHSAPALNYKSGQFLGGIMFADQPLSERQLRWLADLLRKHDLPALATGGEA